MMEMRVDGIQELEKPFQGFPIRPRCATPGCLTARTSLFPYQRTALTGTDEHRAYAFALEQHPQVADMPLGSSAVMVAGE
jgi:hypothetical protein